MNKVEQYRMRADQCDKEAALTLNLEIRAQLERIAEYWRELANLRERCLENRDWAIFNNAMRSADSAIAAAAARQSSVLAM